MLTAFGFGGTGVTLEQLMSPGKVIFLGVEPNRLRLRTSISGVGFAEAWDARNPGLMDGVPVHFISLAGLARNKSSAGHHKDLADVDALSRRDT